MRRRRAERCVQRARAALDAGLVDDAREAIDEALRLDDGSPEIVDLERRIAAAAATPAPAAAERTIHLETVTLGPESDFELTIDHRPVIDLPTHRSTDLPIPEPTIDHGPPIDSAPIVRSAVPGSHRVRNGVAACVMLGLAGAIAFAGWRQRAADGVATENKRPDVRLPAESGVTPVVNTVIVPGSGVHVDLPPVDELAEGLTRVDPPPSAPARPAATEPSPPAVMPQPAAAAGSIGTEVAAPTTGTLPAAPPPRSATREPVAPGTGLAPVSLPAAPVETPAPPPAAPPAEPVVDERPRVRAALSRYESAYSSLDASAAHDVWPAVDLRALERAFSDLASQRVSLGRCDLSIAGTTAHAQCSGTASWTPKVGGGVRTQNRRWLFDLTKSGDEWQIVRAIAR